MAGKISVIINTLNEEKNIKQAIESVKWADEIIVCDMYSGDKTTEIAKKMGAKVFFHQKEGFVEPARNFAISKAANEWILILDADEEIPGTLAEKLKEIAAKTEETNYIRLPRKNIIFRHFMKESMWWPDYNIRFFKKGKVKWTNQIHRPPETSGQGLDLSPDEKYAIVHHSYSSISQFIDRMNRYTDIQADEVKKAGYIFDWKDLFKKPLDEFLSRFFANAGYKDGLHGLALSFLQAFSMLVVYLKTWEAGNFSEQQINLEEFKNEKDRSAFAIDYWIKKVIDKGGFFGKIFKKGK